MHLSFLWKTKKKHFRHWPAGHTEKMPFAYEKFEVSSTAGEPKILGTKHWSQPRYERVYRTPKLWCVDRKYSRLEIFHRCRRTFSILDPDFHSRKRLKLLLMVGSVPVSFRCQLMNKNFGNLIFNLQKWLTILHSDLLYNKLHFVQRIIF